MKPSREAIDDAITALDAFANAAHVDIGLVWSDGGRLASDAWMMVCGGTRSTRDTDAVLRSDALEAAAMLRDGYLPGHDGWTTRIDYEAAL